MRIAKPGVAKPRDKVLLGKRFLHPDSRILYSKEMEHLKNISKNILKNLPITKILKNLVGQFQSIEVSFYIKLLQR